MYHKSGMNLASEDTMPRFDYKCENPDCARVEQNVHVPTSDVSVERICKACLYPMEKLPSAPNFAVKGFSAKNGYSK